MRDGLIKHTVQIPEALMVASSAYGRDLISLTTTWSFPPERATILEAQKEDYLFIEVL